MHKLIAVILTHYTASEFYAGSTLSEVCRYDWINAAELHKWTRNASFALMVFLDAGSYLMHWYKKSPQPFISTAPSHHVNKNVRLRPDKQSHIVKWTSCTNNVQLLVVWKCSHESSIKQCSGKMKKLKKCEVLEQNNGI